MNSKLSSSFQSSPKKESFLLRIKHRRRIYYRLAYLQYIDVESWGFKSQKPQRTLVFIVATDQEHQKSCLLIRWFEKMDEVHVSSWRDRWWGELSVWHLILKRRDFERRWWRREEVSSSGFCWFPPVWKQYKMSVIWERAKLFGMGWSRERGPKIPDRIFTVLEDFVLFSHHYHVYIHIYIYIIYYKDNIRNV